MILQTHSHMFISMLPTRPPDFLVHFLEVPDYLARLFTTALRYVNIVTSSYSVNQEFWDHSPLPFKFFKINYLRISYNIVLSCTSPSQAQHLHLLTHPTLSFLLPQPPWSRFFIAQLILGGALPWSVENLAGDTSLKKIDSSSPSSLQQVVGFHGHLESLLPAGACSGLVRVITITELIGCGCSVVSRKHGCLEIIHCLWLL